MLLKLEKSAKESGVWLWEGGTEGLGGAGLGGGCLFFGGRAGAGAPKGSQPNGSWLLWKNKQLKIFFLLNFWTEGFMISHRILWRVEWPSFTLKKYYNYSNILNL